MSPRMSGQFSRRGSKLSPNRSTTSGVSAISGSVSSMLTTRSAAACDACKSAKMRAMLLIGSKMPVAYCTNAASVPTETSCGTWNTSCPPFQSTSAVATAPRLVTIGMNSALSTAARTEAEHMIRVSCANSSQFARLRA